MQRWMHVWEAYDGLWACSACSGFSVLQISSICTKCTQSGSSDFFSMEASMHGATLLSRMASFALVSTVLLPVLPSPPTIQRLPSKVGWSLSLLIHLEIFGVWTQVSKLQLLETPVQCNRCNLRLWLCISSKRWRTTRPEPCIVLRWDFVPFCLIQNTSCRSKSTNMCAHLGCPTFHIAPRIAPRIAPKHFSNRDWGLPLACVPTARPEIRIWCFDLVWRNKVDFLLRPLCGTWPLQNWPNSSCAAIPF